MNRLFQLFSFSSLLISFFILLLAPSADSQPKYNSDVSEIKKEVNICDLISQQDVEKSLNVSIDHTRNTIQTSDESGNRFVSQCSYYIKTKGFKSVGIQLKYFKDTENPKTYNEFVAYNTQVLDPNDEYEKQMSEEFKTAFENGKKIEKPGLVGAWYNVEGISALMIHFKEHYQLTINLMGFDYTDENFIGAQKLADKVMQNF